MTLQEFETSKTIIQESSWINDTNIDGSFNEQEEMTIEQLEGKLKDGDNLIDLYIDWMNAKLGNEDIFWSECKKILVDQ